MLLFCELKLLVGFLFVTTILLLLENGDVSVARRLFCREMHLSPSLDLSAVARDLHGFTGADIASLVREAAISAVHGEGPPSDLSSASAATALDRRDAEGGDAEGVGVVVEGRHFNEARSRVRPSLTRGLDVEVASVSWDDIGGADDAKRRLKQAVEWPLRHADALARMGVSAPRGVLLYGPPGCSKTTLARAVATATRVAFIPLSCAQLFSKASAEATTLSPNAPSPRSCYFQIAPCWGLVCHVPCVSHRLVCLCGLFCVARCAALSSLQHSLIPLHQLLG